LPSRRCRAQAAHRLPGARPERDAPLQRGGDRLREQRLLRGERVAPDVLIRMPLPDRTAPAPRKLN
jgi:hypothetical protein